MTFELKLALLLKRQQNNHSKLLKELRSRSDRVDRSVVRSIENRNSLDSNGNGSANGPMNGYGNGGTNYSFDADRQVYNGSPDHDEHDDDEQQTFNLQLKGQMMYFPTWKCIAFLGAPK